jgi:hypothetical protein
MEGLSESVSLLIRSLTVYVLMAVGFSLFSKNLFDFSLIGMWWVHVVLFVLKN